LPVREPQHIREPQYIREPQHIREPQRNKYVSLKRVGLFDIFMALDPSKITFVTSANESLWNLWGADCIRRITFHYPSAHVCVYSEHLSVSQDLESSDRVTVVELSDICDLGRVDNNKSLVKDGRYYNRHAPKWFRKILSLYDFFHKVDPHTTKFVVWIDIDAWLNSKVGCFEKVYQNHSVGYLARPNTPRGSCADTGLIAFSLRSPVALEGTIKPLVQDWADLGALRALEWTDDGYVWTHYVEKLPEHERQLRYGSDFSAYNMTPDVEKSKCMTHHRSPKSIPAREGTAMIPPLHHHDHPSLDGDDRGTDHRRIPIIIRHFEKPTFLWYTIASLLASGAKDNPIVIIDDHSRDKTSRALLSGESVNLDRISWRDLSKKSLGLQVGSLGMGSIPELYNEPVCLAPLDIQVVYTPEPLGTLGIAWCIRWACENFPDAHDYVFLEDDLAFGEDWIRQLSLGVERTRNAVCPPPGVWTNYTKNGVIGPQNPTSWCNQDTYDGIPMAWRRLENYVPQGQVTWVSRALAVSLPSHAEQFVDMKRGLGGDRWLAEQTKRVGYSIVAIEPSMVQHIGDLGKSQKSSSLGGALRTPPRVATNFVAPAVWLPELVDVPHHVAPNHFPRALGHASTQDRSTQDRGAQDRGAQDRGAQDRGAQDRSTQNRGTTHAPTQHGGRRINRVGVVRGGRKTTKKSTQGTQ
jgi:hypothetical protein